MWYPSIADFRESLFPYIRERMATDEPAPHYEGEQRGIEKLDGILQLMQRSEYKGVQGAMTFQEEQKAVRALLSAVTVRQ